MITPASFLDTNVLLYSISNASEDAGKRQRAHEILSRRDLALSVQVLQEFYVQATHAKRRTRLDHQAALAHMRTWRRYPVVAITEAVLERALSICAEFRLSYWDSAVIAAAALAGCAEVLSEDLQHGRTIAGVEIRNPFL